MLIILGGFLGSGRTRLARKLAKELGFHYCDLDDYKMHRHEVGSDSTVYSKVQEPATDETRLLLYKRVVQELPLLSKMYVDVVIDDSFHREMPREYFLREARKCFGRIVFVWIDTDEAEVLRLLSLMAEKGLIRSVPGALRRRARAKENFQPPQATSPSSLFRTFLNISSSNDDIRRLRALIETAI